MREGPDSSANHGWQPLLYSDALASTTGAGWQRVGTDVSLHEGHRGSECCRLFTLTFTIVFPEGSEGSACHIARRYPFLVRDLQRDIHLLTTSAARRRTLRRGQLCLSRCGTPIELLVVSNFEVSHEVEAAKLVVALSARARPGDAESSWVMRGFIDFITGPNAIAAALRDRYIFKLVPMLSPDGVEAGHAVCELSAADASLRYDDPSRDTDSAVWHWKSLLQATGERLCMWIDIRTQRNNEGTTMHACTPLPGAEISAEDALCEACALPYALSKHSDDYVASLTRAGVPTNRRTGQGMAWHDLQLAHAYEYRVGESHAGIQQSQRDLERMGQNFGHGLRDWTQARSSED